MTHMGTESKKEYIIWEQNLKECIYVELIHFAIHLKLTQCCKSTILQKNTFFKERNLFKALSVQGYV